MVEVKGRIAKFSGIRKAANLKFERGICLANENPQLAGVWYNLQHGDATILNKQIADLQQGDVVALTLSPADPKLIESLVVITKKPVPVPQPAQKPQQHFKPDIMKVEVAKKKLCPFAISDFCVVENCMAWAAVGEGEGYCKLIKGGKK